jgi:hypothetical protein
MNLSGHRHRTWNIQIYYRDRDIMMPIPLPDDSDVGKRSRSPLLTFSITPEIDKGIIVDPKLHLS